MSYTREVLENWLKTIDVKADAVIDIGGSQLPIKGRTKSWEVKYYKILDLEQPHECKQKPDIVWNLNYQIAFDQDYYKDCFDVAFCIEVSEYWYDPLTALKNISRFLKPNGLLYLSTHFVYPVHSPEGKDYLRYTRWGIEKLLELAGFKIEEIKMRPAMNEEMISFYRSQGMRPSKTYKFHSEVGHLIKARKNG